STLFSFSMESVIGHQSRRSKVACDATTRQVQGRLGSKRLGIGELIEHVANFHKGQFRGHGKARCPSVSRLANARTPVSASKLCCVPSSGEVVMTSTLCLSFSRATSARSVSRILNLDT